MLNTLKWARLRKQMTIFAQFKLQILFLLICSYYFGFIFVKKNLPAFMGPHKLSCGLLVKRNTIRQNSNFGWLVFIVKMIVLGKEWPLPFNVLTRKPKFDKNICKRILYRFWAHSCRHHFN